MPPDNRTTYSGVERRTNPRLRELIDEMLASIRAAHNVALWTDDERMRYEEELSRIMDTVRAEALMRPGGERAKLS